MVLVLLEWGLVELPVGLVELHIRTPPVFLLESLQNGVFRHICCKWIQGGVRTASHNMGICGSVGAVAIFCGRCHGTLTLCGM